MRPDRFVKRRHSPGERTATKETLSVFISVRQRGRERRMKIVKGRDLARRRETFPGCEKPIFKRRYDRSTFAHPRCTHTSLEGRAFDRQAGPSVIDRERRKREKREAGNTSRRCQGTCRLKRRSTVISRGPKRLAEISKDSVIPALLFFSVPFSSSFYTVRAPWGQVIVISFLNVCRSSGVAGYLGF